MNQFNTNTLILISILLLWTVKSQQTISCGQIRTGNRASGEEVEFVFTADQDYTTVYLEGCDSQHDILLHIDDSNGNRILSVDDGNNHGKDISECNNQYAGDITMPNSVSAGDQYSFIVDGYQDASGAYTIQLFCEAADNGSGSGSDDCPRIRKEWNTATQSERNVYINAILTLSQRGILQKFTEQHGQDAAESQAHSTSAFLPWHRQFLFELETQIRKLDGDEYRCFALFYWNWGLDVDQFGGDYDSYSIMNSGLGSRGDSSNNYCVTDGNFARGSYTPYYCPDSWSSNGQCCLRRFTASTSTSTNLWPSTTNELAIVTSSSYGSDTDMNTFRGINEWVQFGPHGTAHCTFGGCGGGGHLGNGRYSPDDPIFYLLHTQVDFMWALWQDYHNYDQVDKDNIHSDIYFGGLDNSGIDTVMEFDILREESWSETRGTETIRDVHSIADMGYKYEYGSFIDDVEFPTSNLDTNWFILDPTRRRRRRRLNEDSMRFDQIAYKQLVHKYGKDYVNTYEGRRKMVETLAKMSCEFSNSGYECERPAYFDDCSDMERGPNIYNNKMDINITLDELIEKVEDYPCMVETRKLMYGFVAELGGLWRLCRGDFDRFCDKQFLTQRPKKGQCEAKGYSKNNKRNRKNQRSASIMYGDMNGIDQSESLQKPENTDFYDRDWMDIIISAGINGIMVGFILFIACIIWICYKQFIQNNKSLGYNKVQKYIDDDNNINI